MSATVLANCPSGTPGCSDCNHNAIPDSCDLTPKTGFRPLASYGIGNLDRYTGHEFDASRFESVQFWVGVGERDDNPAELPRQWDAFEGTTRVQRAQAFVKAMQQLGSPTLLTIFKGVQHELTQDMRISACRFLDQAASASHLEWATRLGAWAPVPN